MSYHASPPPHVRDITKIASMNIDGISAHTRVRMLIDFIRRHDIDVFLQEVTNSAILNITRYATHFNIGSTMRGTATLARHDNPLSVTPLPSGLAIA